VDPIGPQPSPHYTKKILKPKENFTFILSS
jgi:hypothetical protein